MAAVDPVSETAALASDPAALRSSPRTPMPALAALVALVPCGALVVGDRHELCAANARAMALLGFDDADRLAAAWPSLRDELGLRNAGTSGAPAPAAARGLRVEVTRIGEGPGFLALLRTTGPEDAVERTIVAASRCGVQQHVLGGLLHDLNGPLNNIALTLALAAATVTRHFAATPADPVGQRLARQVATLEVEARRLADSSRAMSSVLHAESGEPEPVVLREIVMEVRGQLRHHAALHDIVLETATEGDDAVARADRDAVRFATLALVLATSALCTAGGTVTMRAFARGDTALLEVVAQPATLPDAARRAFDAPVISPPSEWVHLAAARLVANAQGAVATLALRDPAEVVVEIAFRAAR